MTADPFEAQDRKIVKPPHWEAPTDTNYQFESHCHTSQTLFARKNKEYAGAFRKYGLLGVVYEILGVLNRLPPMTIWKPMGQEFNVKKLRDLFVDLHNFSVMALMLIADNNLDGKHAITDKLLAGLDPEEDV